LYKWKKRSVLFGRCHSWLNYQWQSQRSWWRVWGIPFVLCLKGSYCVKEVRSTSSTLVWVNNKTRIIVGTAKMTAGSSWRLSGKKTSSLYQPTV
jgi:hypothetical protein